MHDDPTRDRRSKRSEEPAEALQLLVEAVAGRSDVDALALIDGGRVIAGSGSPELLSGLARIAEAAARGEVSADVSTVCGDTDVMARSLDIGPRGLVLAALGRRVARMHDAASAVARILASA